MALLDIKMMVSPMLLTVPSAAPKQISLSANPNQLKTESLENNLRLCGENWLTNLKFSSLMEMTKVHSSSQRSILAHMSSASKIEGTELENRCSNSLILEAGQTFTLVAPDLSVPGISPEVLSPFFRRLAGRGAFFCGFPFQWVLHFVFYLIRGVALHESPSCSGEDSLDEYGRPMRSSILLSLFSSVASMQPILIGTGDPVSKGSRLHMFYDILCPRNWLVNPFGRFDSSRSSASS